MKTCTRCSFQGEDNLFIPQTNTCRKCQNEMCRSYKARNKDKISAYNKTYKANHKEETKVYNHEYNKNNREQIQKRQNIQHSERSKTDMNYRLRTNLSKRLQQALKAKKTIYTLDLLSCDINSFKSWLEHNFYDDISWENYGKEWHMDHVIPCSLFDLTDIIQQKICFHWSNIQPLHAQKNLEKNNKLYLKDLETHTEKLLCFYKKTKLDCNIYMEFLEKLKYTKSESEKSGRGLITQDHIVKSI
jgi:hypothetical protein